MPSLRPVRPLVAGAIVLVASLGMGANSPSSELTASRLSVLVTVAPVPGQSAVELVNVSAEEIAAAAARGPRRSGPAYYRRITHKRVAPGRASEFLALYREAERAYGVNWRLIASIHRQETAFSTADTTYHGLNAFGCCAGPMQFNVTNGPVSTWETYRNAFLAGNRPKRYPHRTAHHPSIYDDFDAIMAAGSLLRAAGAGPGLGGSEWSAAYAYYGHDLYGVTYASQVLARAAAWQRDGFCANCEPDAGLVEEFEGAYGAAIREQLLAEERRRRRRSTRRSAPARSARWRARPSRPASRPSATPGATTRAVAPPPARRRRRRRPTAIPPTRRRHRRTRRRPPPPPRRLPRRRRPPARACASCSAASSPAAGAAAAAARAAPRAPVAARTA